MRRFRNPRRTQAGPVVAADVQRHAAALPKNDGRGRPRRSLTDVQDLPAYLPG
ncbi:hypothetical protein ACFWHW_25325 [Streptomyces pharetrae]|uniref:hypothetical protein n=1 Tax=Streptomyces pharetrae TaxID=291370 RepID=UPI003665AF1D